MQIKHWLFWGALLLSLGFLSSASELQAAEQKLGVIDMERCFREYYKTKLVEKDFDEQSKVYRNYIARQAELLRAEEETYKKSLDAALSAVLSDSERTKREAEAKKMEQDLRRRRAELEQYAGDRSRALETSAAEARRKVIGEIREEVSRRAAIEGYTIVLDSSGFTLNDTPAVVYFAAVIELTDKVLTELNRGAVTSPEVPGKAPEATAAPKAKGEAKADDTPAAPSAPNSK